MSIEEHVTLTIAGLTVAVVRKDIKNLHLGVYPPDGRVRVAVPLAVSDAAVHAAVAGKLGWIRRQRMAFVAQDRQSEREMVDGESHFYLGQRYRLVVLPVAAKPKVRVAARHMLELHVPPDFDRGEREQVLQNWYRSRLQEMLPPLLEKWQTVLGVRVAFWGLKRMKTKWGSCNSAAGRVWFNAELAKKPPECLEYLVAHELAHLRVSTHDERFTALLDHHVPGWRTTRDRLNAAPLAHEDWRD